MVLHRGSQAGLLPQLSSQYLALSCQRLAHFEEEYPVAILDDFDPVMQHVQARCQACCMSGNNTSKLSRMHCGSTTALP